MYLSFVFRFSFANMVLTESLLSGINYSVSINVSIEYSGIYHTFLRYGWIYALITILFFDRSKVGPGVWYSAV